MNVSVVIRVRNEAEFLLKTLGALAAQKHRNLDVIVVDNHSDDDTREVATGFGARLVSISPLDFSYGRALNIGIAAACGDIILVLSAHSLPIGPDFVDNVVAPFVDPRVGVVRCLHARNANDLEAWTLSKTFAWPVELDEVMISGPVACACGIRRSIWESLPFDEELRSVEDKFWAYEVVKRGHLIAHSNAVYLYTRERKFFESIRIGVRDRLAYYERTGRIFQSPPMSFGALFKTILYRIPKRAFRQTLQEILLFLSVRLIPLRVRKP